MSTQYLRRRNRYAVNVKDISTNAVNVLAIDGIARLPRGNDAQFEIGFFDGDYSKGALPVDMSVYSSVTFGVKDSLTGSFVMQDTVSSGSIDTTLTLDTWADGTKQHALIIFTNAQTSPSLGDAPSLSFYVVFAAVTTGSLKITLGQGSLTIQEDGFDIATTPPLGDPLYLTAIETQALLATHDTDVMKLEDIDNPGTYNLFKSRIVNGVATIVPIVAN